MGLGIAALGGFILLQAVVFPLLERRDRAERRLAAKGEILAEMTALREEYARLVARSQQSRARFGRRPEAFTLYSFLERLAGETGLKDSIAYMKPSTTTPRDSGYRVSQVEVKLQAVAMDKLVAYLYRVETSGNMVSVRRLALTRKGEKARTLNAVLQVETLEPDGGGAREGGAP